MKHLRVYTPSPHRRVPLLIAIVAVTLLACLALLDARPPAVAARPLGQEPATPTLAPGTGAIAGLIWNDLDADGILDPGEPGLGNVQVVARNLQTDATSSATSGAEGAYRITGLGPGTYRVTGTPPAGYTLTTQSSFNVAMIAGVVFTLNFGAWQPPTPTSTPTPPPLLDINGAEELTCGGVYSGTTENLANNVSSYGCKPWWDESGKEAVYRLQLTETQPVTVTLLNASVDLDLFLLRYAYPDSCVAAGENYVTYNGAPGAYFLAVDGYQGAQGSYRFRVDCPLELQATQTPTLTPSPTPTATQTGTPTATQTSAPLQRIYLPLVIRRTSGSGSIPVTFTLQDGLDGYEGTTDTTLNSWNPTTTFGDAKELEIAYADKAISTQKAPVLRFDLRLLPPGAEVQNATLRLYAARAREYDIRTDVQGLLRKWNEDTATWQLAEEDQTWGQPGASAVGVDRGTWVSNGQQLVEGSRWYEFDVTPLVQQWARDQASNDGFVMNALAGDSNTNFGWSFVSREGQASFRPQLVVTYTLAGP